MMTTRICMALLLTLLLGNAVAHADRVYLHGDDDYKSGKLSEMTTTEVRLTGKPPYNVESIRYVRFDNEPADLTKARSRALGGKYGSALKLLKGVNASDIKRPEVRADFAFYEAYCYANYGFEAPTSKQARYLSSAAKRLAAFTKGAGKNNYHLFEAQELLGDVALALAKAKKDPAIFAKARSQFESVANAASSPATKMRLNIKTAQVFQAEGKAGEAASIYQQIVNSGNNSPEAAVYKDRARLGYADSLAANGQADKAIDMVNKVILATDATEKDVLANAYLVLGRCARVGDKPKEELMAMLRIEMLYPQNPEIHEEALGRLAILWTEANEPKRASEAKLKLRSKYPKSEWLKR